eukprot:175619_1
MSTRMKRLNSSQFYVQSFSRWEWTFYLLSLVMKKIIGKSSFYMAMIMKMLWNGNVEILLQFHIKVLSYIYIKDKSITCNKTKATYSTTTCGKDKQGKGAVAKRQKAKAQQRTKEIGKGAYGKTEKNNKRKGKYMKTKDKDEGHTARV